jgi:hypothetical protein
MVGTNGKFFITGATTANPSDNSTFLFSYEILPNGGIGEQVSKIDTGLYTAGASCLSSPANYPGYYFTAELDHTGSYVYAVFSWWGNPSSSCLSVVQTFEISKTGQLLFKGYTTINSALPVGQFPSIEVLGNNKFAYTPATSTFLSFARETSGVLNTIHTDTVLPKAEPGSGGIYRLAGNITPDPTNHFAATLWAPDGQWQIASFTVDTQGNVSTTNTWDNMPALPQNDGVYDMMLDPTGKILAVAYGTGIQLYHFNGAHAITPFTGLVGISGAIGQLAWDDHGHLYGFNSDSSKMHVYDVTSKGMTETAGSRTVVPPSTERFIVRSR